MVSNLSNAQTIASRVFATKSNVFYNYSTKFYQISGTTESITSSVNYCIVDGKPSFRVSEYPPKASPVEKVYIITEMRAKGSDLFKLSYEGEEYTLEFTSNGIYLISKNKAGLFYSSSSENIDSKKSSVFITGSDSYYLDFDGAIKNTNPKYVTQDVSRIENNKNLLNQYPELKTKVEELGGTLTLVTDGLQTKYLKFERNFFYGDELELISYTVECPSCKDLSTSKWETYPGLLKFSCIETSQVLLKIIFRKKECFNNATIAPSKTETIIGEIIKLSDRQVIVSINDNATVDGDIISLTLNGKKVVEKLLLEKCKSSIVLDLSIGSNILCMTAENVGTIPPNTASLNFKSKNVNKSIILKADTNYSECIVLEVD